MKPKAAHVFLGLALAVVSFAAGAWNVRARNAMAARGFDEASTARALAMMHMLQFIYNTGIKTQLLPPVIFLGVGALTDFRPLLSRPITLMLGASAQLGISRGGDWRVLPVRLHR